MESDPNRQEPAPLQPLAGYASSLIHRMSRFAALSGQHTQGLVGRILRQVERSQVWKPDIGSLTPHMVERFSGTVLQRYPDVARKYQVENPPEPAEGEAEAPFVFAPPGQMAAAIWPGEGPQRIAAPPPALPQQLPAPQQAPKPTPPATAIRASEPVQRRTNVRPHSRVEEIRPGGSRPPAGESSASPTETVSRQIEPQPSGEELPPVSPTPEPVEFSTGPEPGEPTPIQAVDEQPEASELPPDLGQPEEPVSREERTPAPPSPPSRTERAQLPPVAQRRVQSDSTNQTAQRRVAPPASPEHPTTDSSKPPQAPPESPRADDTALSSPVETPPSGSEPVASEPPGDIFRETLSPETSSEPTGPEALPVQRMTGDMQSHPPGRLEASGRDSSETGSGPEGIAPELPPSPESGSTQTGWDAATHPSVSPRPPATDEPPAQPGRETAPDQPAVQRKASPPAPDRPGIAHGEPQAASGEPVEPRGPAPEETPGSQASETTPTTPPLPESPQARELMEREQQSPPQAPTPPAEASSQSGTPELPGASVEPGSSVSPEAASTEMSISEHAAAAKQPEAGTTPPTTPPGLQRTSEAPAPPPPERAVPAQDQPRSEPPPADAENITRAPVTQPEEPTTPEVRPAEAGPSAAAEGAVAQRKPRDEPAAPITEPSQEEPRLGQRPLAGRPAAPPIEPSAAAPPALQRQPQQERPATRADASQPAHEGERSAVPEARASVPPASDSRQAPEAPTSPLEEALLSRAASMANLPVSRKRSTVQRRASDVPGRPRSLPPARRADQPRPEIAATDLSPQPASEPLFIGERSAAAMLPFESPAVLPQARASLQRNLIEEPVGWGAQDRGDFIQVGATDASPYPAARPGASRGFVQRKIIEPAAAVISEQVESEDQPGETVPAAAQIQRLLASGAFNTPAVPSAGESVQRVGLEAEAGSTEEAGTAQATGTQEEANENEVDLEKLARQVYPIIKRMLAVERERTRRSW